MIANRMTLITIEGVNLIRKPMKKYDIVCGKQTNINLIFKRKTLQTSLLKCNFRPVAMFITLGSVSLPINEMLSTGITINDSQMTMPGDNSGGRNNNEVIICANDKLRHALR